MINTCLTPQYNTLIVSDIHLGEDLNSATSTVTKRNLDLAERQLTQFLGHYSKKRFDGLPWRLIVNGDLVDFLAIVMLPEEDDDHFPEDLRYGLGRRPGVAQRKLRAVAERHDKVFAALARFIARGNVADVICGNHDTEFHFPAVQQAFREAVVAAYRRSADSGRPDARAAEQIGEAISFHPWFFYEPGVVWVEHGHAYDENCSHEFALAPAHPTDDNVEAEIDANVDTTASRYFTNYIEGAHPHGQESWSTLGHFRWALGLGMRRLWKIARAYTAFTMALLRSWRTYDTRSDAHAARREVHRDRLRAHAARWRLSDSTLAAIDDLRKRPVVHNLRRLLQVLMIDRLALSAVGILTMLIVVIVMPFAWALVGLAVVFATSWLASKWLQRGRIVDPTVPLLLMPERLLRHVDARYVVFGHTHEPVAEPLSDERWYFNTGTWFPSENPGLLRSFTHLMIRHRRDTSSPVATLCQWRDRASRAFTPDRRVKWITGSEAPSVNAATTVQPVKVHAA